MPLAPWIEQPAIAPKAPEKKPPVDMRALGEGGGWTWPWQEKHWARPQPDWTRNVGKWGGAIGLAAGAGALGMAAPGAMFALGSKVPWLSGLAGLGARLAAPTGALGFLGKLGVPAGLFGASVMQQGGPPPPLGLSERGQFPVPPTPTPPTIPTTTPTQGVLPQPGEFPDLDGGTEGEVTGPQVVEVGGQQFWWNKTGGMFGEGGWELIPGQVDRLTPEQQITEAEKDRQAALLRSQTAAGLTPEQEITQLEAQRAAEMAQMQEQARLELERQQSLIQMQGQQQQAQMFAADPYKFWAQMGQGTPEAVARLTGGQVAPGEQMQQGTPMSIPSQQWWGGLLPSEQQQVMGGVNWLGIDPQDWFAMKQKMIPGLGARQAGPQVNWAR